MALFKNEPQVAGEACFCVFYCTVRFYGKDCICPLILDCTIEQRLNCLNSHGEGCREEDCRACKHRRRYHGTRASSTAHVSASYSFCTSFNTSDDGVLGSRSHQQEMRCPELNITDTSQSSAATSAHGMMSGAAAEVMQLPAPDIWSAPRPSPAETNPDLLLPVSAEIPGFQEAREAYPDFPFRRCQMCNSNCHGLCNQSHLVGKSVGIEQPAAGPTAGKWHSTTGRLARKQRRNQSEPSTSSPAVASTTSRIEVSALSPTDAVANSRVDFSTASPTAVAATKVTPVGQNPLSTQPYRPRPTSRSLVASGSPPFPGAASAAGTSDTVSKEWQRAVQLEDRKYMVYHILEANPLAPLKDNWERIINTISAAANLGYTEDGARVTYKQVRGLWAARRLEANIYQSANSEKEYYDSLAKSIDKIQRLRNKKREPK